MFVPSGILVPGDQPLRARQVVKGLYVVEGAYERDLGFFSESPLYAKDADEVAAEEVKGSGQVAATARPAGA